MAALVALGLLAVASAAPADSPSTQNHIVIPGPGLPSLEELGVTSEELYNLPLPELPASDHLERDISIPECGPEDRYYTNVNDLIGCYHYLDKLGSKACVVGGGAPVHMCYSGDATVVGQSIDINKTSSPCRAVAAAVLYTINHCTRPDQTCGGAQYATGNGRFIVASGTKRSYG